MPRSTQKSPSLWQWLTPTILLLIFAGALYAALSLQQLDQQAVYEETQAMLENGEFEQAVYLWRQLLDEQPDSALAAYRLGQLSLLLQPDDAAAYFNRAANLSPEYQQPVQRYRSVLRSAEFSQLPAYRLTLYGQALAAEGEWRLAAEAFSRVTQADPTYGEAWAYFGQAQLQLGQDGYPALQQALQLNPDSLAANLFMAVYWRAQGYPDTALPFLQKAAALQPDNTHILTDLGFTLAATGDIAGAIEQFQRIIEIAPDDLETWQTIAGFSLDNDLQVRQIGLPAARQALLLAPEDAATLLLMARAYSQQGDNLVALRFFQRALDAAPQEPAVHYYLGAHYLVQGENELAQQELGRTIELDEGGDYGNLAQSILADYFE